MGQKSCNVCVYPKSLQCYDNSVWGQRKAKMATKNRTYDKVRAQLDDDRLVRFFDYWRSKATAKRIPARADFDPVEIPELLPWIFLVDVLGDAGKRRIRCRLIGTAIVERTGRDVTGQYFDEGMFTPKTYEAVMAAYEPVIAQGVPTFFASRPDVLLNDALEYTPYTRVLCPLANDGKTVDMLAGLMAFEE